MTIRLPVRVMAAACLLCLTGCASPVAVAQYTTEPGVSERNARGDAAAVADWPHGVPLPADIVAQAAKWRASHPIEFGGTDVGPTLAQEPSVVSVTVDGQEGERVGEEPVGDHLKLKLDVPPLTPVGEPIEAVLTFDAPEGVRTRIDWATDAKWRAKPGPQHAIYLWAKPGGHSLAVTVVVVTETDIDVQNITTEFYVGDPAPPKPLAELAKPDAKALGAVYAMLAAGDYPTLAYFQSVEGLALRDAKLTANAAVPVIAERLAKVAVDDLSATLAAIAKELGADPKPDDPLDPDSPVTAATYIYEKDDTAVPVGVSTGLNRLNRENGIRATLFEDDTVDGDGDVPDQYKAALEAAIKAGLPAFIVMSGDKVLLVVKNPTTEAALMEAVR